MAHLLWFLQLLLGWFFGTEPVGHQDFFDASSWSESAFTEWQWSMMLVSKGLSVRRIFEMHRDWEDQNILHTFPKKYSRWKWRVCTRTVISRKTPFFKGGLLVLRSTTYVYLLWTSLGCKLFFSSNMIPIYAVIVAHFFLHSHGDKRHLIKKTLVQQEIKWVTQTPRPELQVESICTSMGKVLEGLPFFCRVDGGNPL